MAGPAPVRSVGPGLEGARLALEFQMRALKLQSDTLKEVGNLALQLIRSAAIDPAVGRKLDLRV